MPHSSRRPRASSGFSADPFTALDEALTAAAAAPPPAATTFGALGLDDRLVRQLAADGITEPFAIQARALPDALAGRDVLGRAQTGSGKTLAFGLPLLTRLAQGKQRRRERAPRGLILVPTRELAQQVADVLTPLGQRIGLRIATVYGGVSYGRQVDRVRTADLVVATPGRLIDLMDREACDLGNVEISVLDEADHMADLGFLPAVTRILGATPPGGQRLLFSATLDRGVGQLVTAYVRDPALHAVAPAAGAVAASHLTLVLGHPDKMPAAAELAGGPGRTLLFVRTKHGAERLAKQLSRSGVTAAAIHGDRNQNQRQRALDGFTAGYPRVLVATDVAARGIHVDDVDLVVQFDPPKDHKDYLHRAGRTARAGATGMVVTLALPDQVRELGKLYAAAGVTAEQHEVTPGHDVIQKIAAAGVPVVVSVPVPAEPAGAARVPRTAVLPGGRRRKKTERPASPRRRDGTSGQETARRLKDTTRRADTTRGGDTTNLTSTGGSRGASWSKGTEPGRVCGRPGSRRAQPGKPRRAA